MGCAHRRHPVPAKGSLIQLLLAEYLLEEKQTVQLTEHVLDVLKRNARASGQAEPDAIEITACEVVNSNGGVCGVGEKLVNVSYDFKPAS